MTINDLKRSAKFVKFQKLCGMLGSSYANEAGNAAVMATGLLREFNISWADVIGNGGGDGKKDYTTGRLKDEIDRLTRINSNINKDNKDLREKLIAERNKNYELNSKMHQLKNKLSDIEASMKQHSPHVWEMDRGNNAGIKIKIPKDNDDDWRKYAEALRDENLSEWEDGFIESILQRRSLSDKQRAVLNRMVEKYGV